MEYVLGRQDKEVSALMDSDPDLGTSEGSRLDILDALVQTYKARHRLITANDPVEAINLRMDHSRLSVQRILSFAFTVSSVVMTSCKAFLA